ncbi:transposase [Leadbetterella sp. DM7]|uniref:transposase n=1 Tax=Leadbetterella sp. DM7 TaxID=3235085 RepID=UPI00349EA1CA
MTFRDVEGANFWLSALTDLPNQDVKDILILCIDNQTGFTKTINNAFPKAEIQIYVVH